MKRFLISACFIFSVLLSVAQTPKPDPGMIEDIKKEIVELEEDLKQAEKDDPEEAAQIRKQIAMYKGMLANFEKPKQPAVKTGASPELKKSLAYSPITPVAIRQPVTAPAPGQDKDIYFWYRGKKVNDSTLVTRKGMLVQYSKKKQLLIVEPEKKRDSFFIRTSTEIALNQERKDALVAKVRKMTNGFTYYMNMVHTVAEYDDLAARYASAVDNTFSFNNSGSLGVISDHERQDVASNGPQRENDMNPTDMLEWMKAEIRKANQRFQQLAPAGSFPTPPRRDLGLCGQCDTSVLARQRKLDEQWEEEYQGRERAILRDLLSAMREVQLKEDTATARAVNSDFVALCQKISDRMDEKDRILIQRAGNDLQYAHAITPVILGHERQKQLLGLSEGSASFVMEYMSRLADVYKKYYNEQVAAKNHDYVLDLPAHLGMERQKQLLGMAGNSDDDVFGKYLQYNRFAITMDVDFVVEEGDPKDFETRYTGTMAMKEKQYVMLIRDSCRFRMYPLKDLEKLKVDDVLLEFTVGGGQKTYTDDEGKKKTVSYSGPPTWYIRFPDTRIHFCADGRPDTMYLSSFLPSQTNVEAYRPEKVSSVYKGSMGLVANMIWLGFEKGDENNDLLMNRSYDALGAVTKWMSTPDPGDPLGSMRNSYEGWRETHNAGIVDIAKTMNTDKATVVFQSANRSTVVTDTHVDTKRGNEDWTIKRGLTGLRIVHEPVVK